MTGGPGRMGVIKAGAIGAATSSLQFSSPESGVSCMVGADVNLAPHPEACRTAACATGSDADTIHESLRRLVLSRIYGCPLPLFSRHERFDVLFRRPPWTGNEQRIGLYQRGDLQLAPLS